MSYGSIYMGSIIYMVKYHVFIVSIHNTQRYNSNRIYFRRIFVSVFFVSACLSICTNWHVLYHTNPTGIVNVLVIYGTVVNIICVCHIKNKKTHTQKYVCGVHVSYRQECRWELIRTKQNILFGWFFPTLISKITRKVQLFCWWWFSFLLVQKKTIRKSSSSGNKSSFSTVCGCTILMVAKIYMLVFIRTPGHYCILLGCFFAQILENLWTYLNRFDCSYLAACQNRSIVCFLMKLLKSNNYYLWMFLLLCIIYRIVLGWVKCIVSRVVVSYWIMYNQIVIYQICSKGVVNIAISIY